MDAQCGAARNGKPRVSVQNLGVSREVRSYTSPIDDIEPTIRNRHFEIAAAVSDLELTVHHVGPHVCILDSLDRHVAVIDIHPGDPGVTRDGERVIDRTRAGEERHFLLPQKRCLY